MKNEYFPRQAVIKGIVSETPDTKTFSLRLKGKVMRYKPGQFLMLSLAGFGEAPFTYASMFRPDGIFQVSIRQVGTLTAALHNLKVNALVGVRGPYGNSFPLNKFKNKGILFIAGGCGIAPLRPLIQHVSGNRKSFAKVEIIYGCRTPNDLAYRSEFKAWSNNPDTEVRLAAIQALGRIGGSEAKQVLTRCLRDPSKAIREMATEALNELELGKDPLSIKIRNTHG